MSIHGQQYVNGGTLGNVNAFNPQHTYYLRYTNTSPHQPAPDMRHISVAANTAYTINWK